MARIYHDPVPFWRFNATCPRCIEVGHLRALHRFEGIQVDVLTMAAASGMRSRLEGLDLLANNLANAAAPGYKADQELYSTYLANDLAPGGPDSPIEPTLDKHWTDFNQGTLAKTGNPLDLAINGKGFFQVSSQAGMLYTRNGSFRLSAKGELETSDGNTLIGEGGRPIVVDSSEPVEVARDGAVMQNGVEVGRIQLVDFSTPTVLTKKGQNYFGISVSDYKPAAATATELEQGALEGANVQPARAAVQVVTIMRQFEMLQKAMNLGMDLNKQAIDDVARVGS